MAVTIQVGAIGVQIIMPLTFADGRPVDLSTAVAMKVYFRAPDASSSTEKAASRVGSGKEGKLIYTTVAGDLPVTGDWRIQSRVLFDNPTRDFWSTVHPFVVAANLA